MHFGICCLPQIRFLLLPSTLAATVLLIWFSCLHLGFSNSFPMFFSAFRAMYIFLMHFLNKLLHFTWQWKWNFALTCQLQPFRRIWLSVFYFSRVKVLRAKILTDSSTCIKTNRRMMHQQQEKHSNLYLKTLSYQFMQHWQLIDRILPAVWCIL